jgi:peroxiredoxin
MASITLGGNQYILQVLPEVGTQLADTLVQTDLSVASLVEFQGRNSI